MRERRRSGIAGLAVLATLAASASACEIGQKNSPLQCAMPTVSIEQTPRRELNTPNAKLKADAKRLLDIRNSYRTGTEHVVTNIYGKSKKDPGELAITTESLDLVFTVTANDPLLDNLHIDLRGIKKEDVDRTEFKFAALRNDQYPDTVFVFVDGKWYIGKTPSPADYAQSTLEAYAKSHFKEATAGERTDVSNSIDKTVSDLDELLKKTDTSSCQA